MAQTNLVDNCLVWRFWELKLGQRKVHPPSEVVFLMILPSSLVLSEPSAWRHLLQKEFKKPTSNKIIGSLLSILILVTLLCSSF